MITRYTTKNGGVYEIDDAKKLFRKVAGGAHTSSIPTEWNPYRGVIYPYLDCLLIDHNLRTCDGQIVTSKVLTAEPVGEVN